jgi:hypothetical protein
MMLNHSDDEKLALVRLLRRTLDEDRLRSSGNNDS